MRPDGGESLAVKMCCSAEQRYSSSLPAASAGSSPRRLRPSHRTLPTVTLCEEHGFIDTFVRTGLSTIVSTLLPFYDDIAGTALLLLFQELCAVPLLYPSLRLEKGARTTFPTPASPSRHVAAREPLPSKQVSFFFIVPSSIAPVSSRSATLSEPLTSHLLIIMQRPARRTTAVAFRERRRDPPLLPQTVAAHRVERQYRGAARV
jgi:hypothetical protein